jgi:transglutaminase/protease-like cytokinesis protein 3
MKFLVLILLISMISSLYSQSDYLDYSDIDSYVLNTPSKVENNIQSLASYLIKPARTEREKVRALYRWVAENINYDVQSYLMKYNKQRSIQQILSERSTVCDGYSRLMAELAKAIDIEMVQVIGYSKGYDYKIGDRFDGNPNHAWNAVKMNGRWYLLDVTWGAGYIDEDNRFIKRFQDHYFLTPPESFILDHLPQDERWQLIDQPITLKEFENGLFLRPAFFQYGLSVKNQYKNTLDVYNETKIEFYTPDNVSLIAQLFQDENPFPEYLTFGQRKSGQFKIDVQIPKSGEYILRIYAKKMDNSLKFEWVSDYRIEASGGKGKSAGFPFTYATFVNQNVYLYEPLNRYLPAGHDQKFKIFIPGAKGAAVKVNDEWIFLEGQGNLFEGYVPIKKGTIQVLARFNEGNQFSALLDYIGQ